MQDILIEETSSGAQRINRINYEICVLQALRDRLRCKEIWVEGADRFRHPDEDLPSDFSARRGDYYAALNQPHGCRTVHRRPATGDGAGAEPVRCQPAWQPEGPASRLWQEPPRRDAV